MPDRWQFEKVGLGYRVWSDAMETELRLTHIKRSRGELQGELAVKTHLANAKTQNGGVLHVARFNVVSSTSRNALAKMLGGRTPGIDMDWFDPLECLCQNVLLSEMTGEAIDEVGTMPPTPPHARWLVEPLIRRDEPGLVFGPPGVGKSLIALTCGLSVALGREIIPGVAPAIKGNVLYLDWETRKEVINDRIQAIARGHGFTPSGMLYRRCVRPLADDAEQLSAIVAERKIVLVIVDSAGYAQGAQGEYGDANEAVMRMHEALRLIGVSSQIIDHVNKADARAKPGTATPYGSQYKTANARITWEVRKIPSVNGLSIALYHAKANDSATLPPIGIDLDWTDDAITFRKTAVIEEPYDEGSAVSTADAIRELLSDGARMNLPDMARTLSRIKYDTIKGTLRRMVERGELARDDDGRYAVAQAPVRLRSLPGSKGVDA